MTGGIGTHDGGVVGSDEHADGAAAGGVDARVKRHQVGVVWQRIAGSHRHLLHAVVVLPQAPHRQRRRIQRLQVPLAPQLRGREPTSVLSTTFLVVKQDGRSTTKRNI